MKKLLLFTLVIFYTAGLLAQTGGKDSGTTKNGEMLPANDIVKNISSASNTKTFYRFIKKANLSRTYTSRGPITIFVPDDEAYNDLPAGKLDSLLKPAHIWDLTDLVTYHAICGKLKVRDIEKQINHQKGMATFTTLSGSKLSARIDSNNNIVLIDGSGGKSTITRADIEQNNGLIHIVNKVLVPKHRLM